jgi:SAM-dependent methyltransferase
VLPTEQEFQSRMKNYLNGDKLWGDDFTGDQLVEWFNDETEGYANLGSRDRNHYKYGYHGLNMRYGYRFTGKRIFSRAFGLGSAYGDEFLPISARIKRITITEPSEVLRSRDVAGIPIDYVAANPFGKIDCPENTFDLITCFGVLHHIANVSFVLSELARCLKSDGVMLVREPIISMGDWRQPRHGATKRERGIPLPVFQRAVFAADLLIKHQNKCMFSLTRKLNPLINGSVWNSRVCLLIDEIMCRAFGWNSLYHATSNFEKLRATSVFLVLGKRQ